MGTLNDYRLSNDMQDKEDGGGLIGVYLPDPENPGEKVKTWFPEDKFTEMFTEGDKKTKEILMDALKTGKSKSVSEDIPAKPEPVPPKPPDEWDFQPEDHAREVAAPRSGAVEKATPDDTLQNIIAGKTLSPYSSEGREQKRTQRTPTTPENFFERERLHRAKFQEHIMGKYGKYEITPVKDAIALEISENEPKWFEEFASKNGWGELEYGLLSEYERDRKNEDLQIFLDEWKRANTAIKGAMMKEIRRDYVGAKNSKMREIYDYEEKMNKKRYEMKEIERLREEEAEQYTPDKKVKDLESLQKTEDDLLKAREEGKPRKIEALELKMRILKTRLDIKEETVDETSGLRNENVEKYLDKEGLSEKDKERYREEYNRRLKLAGKK